MAPGEIKNLIPDDQPKRQVKILLLIASVVFIVLIVISIALMPFFLKRLNLVADTLASKTKAPISTQTASTKAQSAKKTKIPTADYDIPTCNPVQPSNPAALQISTASPGLKTNSEDLYYEIFGNNISDLSGQLHTCGPKTGGESFAGITLDYINWSYLMKFDADGSCRVDSATAGVNVRIYYPKWDAREKASASTIDRWDNMISSLRLHEEGHRQIDYDGGRELLNTISTITGTSCDEVQQKVNSQTKLVTDKISERNEEYDNKTNHGESQGATL